MKTKILLLATVAALSLFSSPVLAQEKGATKLLPLRSADNLEQVEAGDSIVMSCPKCKDTYVTKVTKSMRGMTPDEVKIESMHMCPTCETTIKTTGMGRNAKNKLVHTCNMCGSTDVSCCLMKKDGGMTPGMAEKK